MIRSSYLHYKKNKSTSTALNEKSHDYILGSELSPKENIISDIETEIIDLKAKISKLEVKRKEERGKRKEVEMAIKQIESDIGKCTNKTELQQPSAKLSTKEYIYNSLTQEIVAQ